MEKVLVEIFVPALQKSFDVFLPLTGKMSEVQTLVAGALSRLSEGKYLASKDSILCDAKTGTIYDINATIQDLGIQNGSKMMLM